MSTSDKKQPIIIKRVQGDGHGQHGGSWKVAYADFVTAMMAFFLLMWLLGTMTDAQKTGVSDWFKNPSGVRGPGGASISMIKLGGALELPRSKKREHQERMAKSKKQQKQQKDQKDKKDQKDRKTIEVVKEVEKKQLDALLESLKEAIERSQALKPFKDQLKLDITPDGLRIQIIDKEGRPMFDLAQARLKPYMKGILREISKVISKVPNRVSIAGHTDATPFAKGYYREYEETEERTAYTNWELSSDRANAARREMVKNGMHPDKIGRVVGLASSVLFDKRNPRSPVNRRISIIVMNRDAEKAMGLSERKAAKKAKVVIPKKRFQSKRPATVDELKKLIPKEQLKVR